MEKINVLDVGQLPDVIRELRALGIPAFIFGPPGIGKTEGIQAALEKDDILIDLRASQLDPVDVRGVPVVVHAARELKEQIELTTLKLEAARKIGDEKLAQTLEKRLAGLVKQEVAGEPQVVWSRPDFWPREGKGIIVFEELNTAPPSVQNTLLQPFGAPPGSDRFVGPHRIPKTFYLCATGNRKEDQAHVISLSSALRGRAVIINIPGPNLDSWTTWAVRNGIEPVVVAFIRFRPDLLYQPPPAHDETAPFPSPRAWARFVSPLVARGFTTPEILAAAVGEEAAAEFLAFLREVDNMPDIDRLLVRPEEFDPQQLSVSVRYAVIAALIHRVISNPELLKPSLAIALKFEPEMAAVFISTLNRHSPEMRTRIVATAEAHRWVAKHSKLVRL